MKRPRPRLLLTLGALALLLAVLPTCGVADPLFYRPTVAPRPDPAATEVPGAEAVTLQAPGGPRLSGLWLPARGPARGTVVYCHGNRGHLLQHLPFVRWLPGLGYQVLLFDYRGYGASEGAADRPGTVADTLAAVDFALGRDPDRTVLFGHSLGGALAIWAGGERPAVRAVIAESTFPSYRQAACCTVPALGFCVPLLVSPGFDPLDALPRLPPRPLLVIHGTADRITPLELGQELHARAAEPKHLWVIEGAGHRSDSVRNEGRFAQQIGAFLASVLSD